MGILMSADVQAIDGETCASAYVQTHSFDLRSLGIRREGYALFASSGTFDGSESVEVTAPTIFPDTESQRRQLMLFEKKGEWSQSSHERIKSALSGALPAGTYLFDIRSSNESRCALAVDHQNHFLDPARSVEAKLANDFVEIRWVKPSAAQSSLVALLPFGGKFPEDVFVISNPDFRGNKFQIRSGLFPRGEYWVLIRSNQHLPAGMGSGYLKESWGMSRMPFKK